MPLQGSPEGTIQVQVTLLAKEALGQPELAASSDARLQAAFGQAGKGEIVQTGQATVIKSSLLYLPEQACQAVVACLFSSAC